MKKLVGIMIIIIIVASITTLSVYAKPDNSVIAKEIALKEANKVEKVVKSSAIRPEIDEAKIRVDKEEAYIASIITTLSGSDTDVSRWEYNLKYLQDNYNVIQDKFQAVNINMAYVDSYIEAYKTVKLLKNAPAEKDRSNAVVKASANYSRDKAIEYAKKYYNNYNPNYSDWTSEGGDCANFISQCLYAGGKKMKGTPGTESAAQNFANWFSKGNKINIANVSSTWRGADAFRNYWQSNAVGYKKFSICNEEAYNYGYRGDAISLLNSNSRAYHTLMIVGYSSGDLIYAAHTYNTISGSLNTISQKANGFIIYHMYE